MLSSTKDVRFSASVSFCLYPRSYTCSIRYGAQSDRCSANKSAPGQSALQNKASKLHRLTPRAAICHILAAPHDGSPPEVESRCCQRLIRGRPRHFCGCLACLAVSCLSLLCMSVCTAYFFFFFFRSKMPICVLAADHTRHIWGVRVRLSQSTEQNEYRISKRPKIHEPMRQTDTTRQATYQVL